MALVLGLTCLTSCSDFLNRQPTNSGNADEAIATQRDAEVAINGMMFKMSSSSYYGRNFLLYGDAKGGASPSTPTVEATTTSIRLTTRPRAAPIRRSGRRSTTA